MRALLLALATGGCSEPATNPTDLAVSMDLAPAEDLQTLDLVAGSIYCGQAGYCNNGQVCCGTYEGPNAYVSTCVDSAADCVNTVDGGITRSLACDGPEDCNGEACCASLSQIGLKTRYSNVVCGAAPRNYPGAYPLFPDNPTCVPYGIPSGDKLGAPYNYPGGGHGDTRRCHSDADCATTLSLPEMGKAFSNCCHGSFMGFSGQFCFDAQLAALVAAAGYPLSCP
jgi:hypothetical protein